MPCSQCCRRDVRLTGHDNGFYSVYVALQMPGCISRIQCQARGVEFGVLRKRPASLQGPLKSAYPCRLPDAVLVHRGHESLPDSSLILEQCGKRSTST